MEIRNCTYNHDLKNLIPQVSEKACRLDNFIKCWNNQTNLHQVPIDVKSDFNLRIVYHSCKNLYDGNEYDFGQEYYISEKPSVFLPTIHLTVFHIFENRFSKEESKDFNNMENNIANSVRRYKRVIDSSIWNYYVPIMTKESEFDFKNFMNVLCEIGHNYEEGRYGLNVTFEFADLNARLLKQSHLNGNHKAVSPFLFHSESEIKDKGQNLGLNGELDGQKKVINEVKEYKWRFLLVDDKSIKCMSRVSLNGNNSKDVNKLQVISNNLSRILGFNEEQIWFRTEFEEKQGFQKKELIPLKFGMVKDGSFDKGVFKTINKKPDKDENIQIIIDCVENIKDAIRCLNYYEYEIVLLDYLLDNNCNLKQEYGYQFLNYLYKYKNDSDQSETEKILIGPNNRLSIMFISAFTTAVNERILEKGFGRSERGLWYIGNSACPTNTPYLFSYFLLQLMRHRIEGLKNGSEGQLFTIIDLLEEIYVKVGNSGIECVRKEANSHFNHLLFMRAKYKRLMNDLDEKEEKDLKEHYNESQYIANYLMDMNSSLLVYSAFKVVHHFSEAFFDHLQHLVYLTAFGTIRQWQDMWEEYVFVYKELYDYDNYVVEYDEDNNVKKRGKMICNAIKEYIINLKENSI